jgi:hypothetical protein
MIQFNLLPDIKMRYIKAKRQQHLVMLASGVSIIAAAAIFIMLIVVVHVVQKKNLSDLNRDIKRSSQQLKDTPDLNKILTVQNQLQALPQLHDQKAVSSRIFKYMSQLTPTSATIAKYNVDFAQDTMNITGSADTLTTVNKFTDTLKFTKYTLDTSSDSKPAFSDVVLANFSRDSKAATYTINLKFDPVIFQENTNVTLTVPNIISTRSEVEQPSALFKNTEAPAGTNR